MTLSNFGKKFTRRSGILELMDDLGQTMSGAADYFMLGGGNPAVIPAMQAVWEEELERLRSDAGRLTAALAFYDTPTGSQRWREAMAELLRSRFGMNVSAAHIGLTNGSQNAFFILFNLFAGAFESSRRRVLFPLAPEYIGYADQALGSDTFFSHPAKIETLDGPFFKYHVDFDTLKVPADVGLMCASRPTNPSGNVLTDGEVHRLLAVAREHGIPLIIDNAYGAPFPGILFSDITPFWEPGMILVMSLSKLGLPGLRTGIVIADPAVIEAVASVHAIMNLAGGNLGPALTEKMLRDGRILDLARSVIGPFYKSLRDKALAHLRASLDSKVEYRVHLPEGALFLWVSFPSLKISSRELYSRLKERGVLVVPGEYFFFGLDEPDKESTRCIRLTFSQGEETFAKAMPILAEVVARNS